MSAYEKLMIGLIVSATAGLATASSLMAVIIYN